MSYIAGDPWVYCDMSGFKVRMSNTVKTWNGLRVARRFAGEETRRHPQENIRGVKDVQTVKDGRPEPTDVFVDPGDVTVDDL